jgi:glycosyltransferase involved in cell wall biosynthesis
LQDSRQPDEGKVLERAGADRLAIACDQPLVSVVTPFHNTAPYLAQCIESVLSQSYLRFEYILSDNCSTDGSLEIAEQYARRDSRVRIVRQPQLLTQVPHYNAALAEISDASRYCKIVQADDYIFQDCLGSQVRAGEQAESVGLVSSYWLKGDDLRGSGFPIGATFLPGREMARLYLRTGLWVFGSPTAVLYRSSLIREAKPFYSESALHEDTEKCMEILDKWDFGFVHQVLSFSRADNESISSAVRTLLPVELDRYIIVRRYAAMFLDMPEAAALKSSAKQIYYRRLAQEVLRSREPAFWNYHRAGLKKISEKLDSSFLAWQVGRVLLGMAANPGTTVTRAMRLLQRKTGAREVAAGTTGAFRTR